MNAGRFFQLCFASSRLRVEHVLSRGGSATLGSMKMRRAGVLLLALLIVATAALGAPPAKPKDPKARARAMADEGLALVAKGQWADAEEAFEDAIELGSVIPADHYNL